MKCRRHPDRWPDHGIDDSKLGLISECRECLDVLEYRLLLEIESGNIPPVSADFPDRVMRNIAGKPTPARLNQVGKRKIERETGNKRLTFIHYIAAATATITLVTTGCFNTIFKSGPEYGDSANKFVSALTNKAAIKIPDGNGLPDSLSRDFKINMKRLEKLKNDLRENISGENER
jgi:hypothetical protein